MKAVQRSTLCALFALCSLCANAYDFWATNDDRVAIYYIVVTSDEYTYAVQVTKCGNSRGYYTGTIRIPEIVTNNSNLRKYTVIGISNDALSGNYIKDIELPKTISYTKGGSIGGIKTTSITVDEENPYFCDVDGVMFSKDMKTLIRFPCSSPLLPSYDIPDGVTEISEHAFSGCSGLTGELIIPDSVTTIGERAFSACSGFTGALKIPDSVTTIESSAFYGCTGLTSIDIPNSMTTIGDYAFAYSTGLTSVVLGNGVTSIGTWAFYECTGLTSVTIGNGVTSIGGGAFSNCTKLESIYSLNPEPPECGGGVFLDVTKERSTLYVPIDSYRAYATAYMWKDFLNIVEMDMTGIESVSADDAEVVGYYTIGGTAVDAPQRGVNIVKYSDGSTKKVLVK